MNPYPTCNADEVIFVKESPARIRSPKSRIKQAMQKKMMDAIQQANNSQTSTINVKQKKE